jgi:protein-L-isoaspartate(D-aspartate) O-methyltransferase
MNDIDSLQFARNQMVENQIIHRGITDPRVLDAMRIVPRHLFVPVACQNEAYGDYPIPIGMKQTISQPYIVALMVSLLHLKGDEKILEVGTGSGYQAAILSHLAKKVFTIEIIPQLSREAKRILDSLSIRNVEIISGDGSIGYAKAAPYDGIIVTAAAPLVSPQLFEQLTPKGILVIPVGSRGVQELQVWEQEIGTWQMESVLPVAFVPLRGDAGWRESDWL